MMTALPTAQLEGKKKEKPLSFLIVIIIIYFIFFFFSSRIIGTKLTRLRSQKCLVYLKIENWEWKIEVNVRFNEEFT